MRSVGSSDLYIFPNYLRVSTKPLARDVETVRVTSQCEGKKFWKFFAQLVSLAYENSIMVRACGVRQPCDSSMINSVFDITCHLHLKPRDEPEPSGVHELRKDLKCDIPTNIEKINKARYRRWPLFYPSIRRLLIALHLHHIKTNIVHRILKLFAPVLLVQVLHVQAQVGDQEPDLHAPRLEAASFNRSFVLLAKLEVFPRQSGLHL
jgi:hypothetical protein